MVVCKLPIVYPRQVPALDQAYFAKGTTYDASESGGSDPACVGNVREGWKRLKDLGSTKEGEWLLHP